MLPSLQRVLLLSIFAHSLMTIQDHSHMLQPYASQSLRFKVPASPENTQTYVDSAAP